MNIRQTSLMAHQDISTDGTADSQRMTILRHIRDSPEGINRFDISRNLDIPINAVTGRCKELLKLQSIYEDGKRINNITKKMNLILKPSEIKVYTQ